MAAPDSALLEHGALRLPKAHAKAAVTFLCRKSYSLWLVWPEGLGSAQGEGT